MADSRAIDCGQHGMWVIGGELTDEQATAAALARLWGLLIVEDGS